MIKKIILLTTIIFLVYTGVTFAGFFDEEIVTNNSVVAGFLDITLVKDMQNIESILFDSEISPSDFVQKTFTIENEGSEYKYKIKINVEDELPLCDALTLNVNINSDDVYNGNIYDVDDTTFNSNTDENIELTFLIENENDSSFHNSTCDFDITVESWQSDLLSFGGFTDTETILNNTLFTYEWDVELLPYVKVLYPNGGTNQIFIRGQDVEITWEAYYPGIPEYFDYVTINYSIDGGVNYINLNPWTPNTGSYIWEGEDMPTELISNMVLVQVVYALIYGQDESDSTFTFIENPIYAGNIVMNEILADPLGLDNAALPAGEFVEIYNKSTSSFDLNGWYLEDSELNRVYITDINTSSSSTVINPSQIVAVYLNSAFTDWLNNTADTVTLYDSLGFAQDTYSYTSTIEEKSVARIPDGIGPWIDPVPTPGEPNILENGLESTQINDPFTSSTAVELEPVINEELVLTSDDNSNFENTDSAVLDLSEESLPTDVLLDNMTEVEPEQIIPNDTPYSIVESDTENNLIVPTSIEVAPIEEEAAIEEVDEIEVDDSSEVLNDVVESVETAKLEESSNDIINENEENN